MYTQPSLISPTRQGSAFIVVVAVMVLLLSLSTILTDVTISDFKGSERRKDQVALLVSAESLGNLSINFLQNLPNLDNELTAVKGRNINVPAMDITSGVSGLAINDTAFHLSGDVGGGSGRQTLNGFSTRVAWAHHGTVTVPWFGQTRTTDVYRVVATIADGGPARIMNADGTENPITHINRYRRERVEIMFVPMPNAVFQQAMYARKGYEFKGSASTDSWNSNNGAVTYASSATGSQGDLSSSGSILVQKREDVKGEVNPNITMPVPTLTYNPSSAATVLPNLGQSNFEFVTGTYRAVDWKSANGKNVSVAAGAVVTLYVDGPIQLEDFTVPTSARFTIWQNNYNRNLGTTTINGGRTIGNINYPGSFIWISLFDGLIPDASATTSIECKLTGGADLGGVMVWPYASFHLNGSFNFYGAILAESFRDKNDLGLVNGNYKFHYDESLANLSIPLPPTLVVVGWRALPLSLAQSWDTL